MGINFSSEEYQLKNAQLLIKINNNSVSSADIADFKNLISTMDEFKNIPQYVDAYVVDYLYKQGYLLYQKNYPVPADFDSKLTRFLGILNDAITFNVAAYKAYANYTYKQGSQAFRTMDDAAISIQSAVDKLDSNDNIFFRLRCYKALMTMYLVDPVRYVNEYSNLIGIMQNLIDQRNAMGVDATLLDNTSF